MEIKFEIGDQVEYGGQLAEVGELDTWGVGEIGIYLDAGNPDSGELTYVSPDDLKRVD